MKFRLTSFHRGLFSSGWGLAYDKVQIGSCGRGRSVRRMVEGIIETINEEIEHAKRTNGKQTRRKAGKVCKEDAK